MRDLRFAIWTQDNAIWQLLVPGPSLYILRLARIWLVLRHCVFPFAFPLVCFQNNEGRMFVCCIG